MTKISRIRVKENPEQWLELWTDDFAGPIQYCLIPGGLHNSYELQSNKGIANGYCPLDATIQVPTVNLGSGTADATTFLRGDRTWAPAGGGGPPAPHASSHITGTDQLADVSYPLIAGAGTHGLVPAPTNPMDATKALLGTGLWGDPGYATSAGNASTLGGHGAAYFAVSGAAPTAHASSHTTGTDQLSDVSYPLIAGAGTHGLVPAPTNPTDATHALLGSGSWGDPGYAVTAGDSGTLGGHGAAYFAVAGAAPTAHAASHTTGTDQVADLVGCTLISAGVHGLVPAPGIIGTGKALLSNGSWGDPAYALGAGTADYAVNGVTAVANLTNNYLVIGNGAKGLSTGPAIGTTGGIGDANKVGQLDASGQWPVAMVPGTGATIKYIRSDGTGNYSTLTGWLTSPPASGEVGIIDHDNEIFTEQLAFPATANLTLRCTGSNCLIQNSTVETIKIDDGTTGLIVEATGTTPLRITNYSSVGVQVVSFGANSSFKFTNCRVQGVTYGMKGTVTTANETRLEKCYIGASASNGVAYNCTQANKLQIHDCVIEGGERGLFISYWAGSITRTKIKVGRYPFSGNTWERFCGDANFTSNSIEITDTVSGGIVCWNIDQHSLAAGQTFTLDHLTMVGSSYALANDTAIRFEPQDIPQGALAITNLNITGFAHPFQALSFAVGQDYCNIPGAPLNGVTPLADVYLNKAYVHGANDKEYDPLLVNISASNFHLLPSSPIVALGLATATGFDLDEMPFKTPPSIGSYELEAGLDADTLDGLHATAFATAIQGGKADTAVQPNVKALSGNFPLFDAGGNPTTDSGTKPADFVSASAIADMVTSAKAGTNGNFMAYDGASKAAKDSGNKAADFALASHAKSHTDGTDDIALMAAGQKGLCAAPDAKGADAAKALLGNNTYGAFDAAGAAAAKLAKVNGTDTHFISVNGTGTAQEVQDSGYTSASFDASGAAAAKCALVSSAAAGNLVTTAAKSATSEVQDSRISSDNLATMAVNGVATGLVYTPLASKALAATSTLYWDDTNNRLGIGVAPTYALDILQATGNAQTSIKTNATTAYAQARVAAGASAVCLAAFGSAYVGGATNDAYLASNASFQSSAPSFTLVNENATGKIQGYAGGALSANNIFTATTTGFGLGSGDPKTALHIKGATVDTTIGLAGAANYCGNLYYSSGYKYVKAGAGVGLFLTPNGATAGDFSVYTAPNGVADAAATITHRFSILENGNVGIGSTVTAPTTALHVVKTTEQMRLGYDLTKYTSFTVGSTGQFLITPNQADGATAIATTLNSAAFTTAGAKLLSVQNNSVEKFYVDKDGMIPAASLPAPLASTKGGVALPASPATPSTYYRDDGTWVVPPKPSTITITVDGGGTPIPTGYAGWYYCPAAGKIKEWVLLADVSGSVVVDVWKTPFASYPPTNANSISQGYEPSLVGQLANRSSTFTGWTTTDIAAGDVFGFNVDSAATLTRITFTLRVEWY